METQGYQVQDNILFQDNKSTILLEKNGKASSSKHTKHEAMLKFGISLLLIASTRVTYHWSGVRLET
jgi:hypothetical protein